MVARSFVQAHGAPKIAGDPSTDQQHFLKEHDPQESKHAAGEEHSFPVFLREHQDGFKVQTIPITMLGCPSAQEKPSCYTTGLTKQFAVDWEG